MSLWRYLNRAERYAQSASGGCRFSRKYFDGSIFISNRALGRSPSGAWEAFVAEPAGRVVELTSVATRSFEYRAIATSVSLLVRGGRRRARSGTRNEGE